MQQIQDVIQSVSQTDIQSDPLICHSLPFPLASLSISFCSPHFPFCLPNLFVSWSLADVVCPKEVRVCLLKACVSSLSTYLVSPQISLSLVHFSFSSPNLIWCLFSLLPQSCAYCIIAIVLLPYCRLGVSIAPRYPSLFKMSSLGLSFCISECTYTTWIEWWPARKNSNRPLIEEKNANIKWVAPFPTSQRKQNRRCANFPINNLKPASRHFIKNVNKNFSRII